MLFLIIGFLVLPSFARADDFVLSGYTEVGQRSTAEDYEEEDTDNDYTYRNYHLRFEEKVSDRLSYDIGSFVYDKDYESKDSLDNIARIFKTRWSYYPGKLAGESLRLDFRLKYKEKRYDNKPGNDYNQFRVVPSLTFERKDLYTVNLAAGIDDFNYLEAGEKDQDKIFGRVGGKRYFLGKKLRLISSYQLEAGERKKRNRERTQQNLRGGFNYIFDFPWVYKITARVSWGERDTKEEDERDEDYDYEYWRYYARTEHRITPRLKTNLKYQYFQKDYVSADLDHRGFYIRNGWNYEVLDDEKQRVRIALDVEHKDVGYNLKTGNDYRKETAEVKVTYRRKKSWKASASLRGNFYGYNDSGKDKKRYYVKLSGEKLFLEGALSLSLDLKYRYTDYDKKNDLEQGAMRVAFKYKF